MKTVTGKATKEAGLQKAISEKELDPRALVKMAQQAWNFRMAGSYAELIAWRSMAILEAVIIILTLYFSFTHIVEPKLLPFVVVEEKATGKVEFAGRIQGQTITITDRMYINYFHTFIDNLRTITAEPALMKKNLIKDYFFIMPSAKPTLDDIIRESNPFEKADRQVVVDLDYEVEQKMGENTWRLQWSETSYKSGMAFNKVIKSGIFTTTRGETSSDEAANANPLGLFITSFSIADVRNQ